MLRVYSYQELNRQLCCILHYLKSDTVHLLHWLCIHTPFHSTPNTECGVEVESPWWNTELCVSESPLWWTCTRRLRHVPKLNLMWIVLGLQWSTDLPVLIVRSMFKWHFWLGMTSRISSLCNDIKKWNICMCDSASVAVYILVCFSMYMLAYVLLWVYMCVLSVLVCGCYYMFVCGGGKNGPILWASITYLWSIKLAEQWNQLYRQNITVFITDLCIS